MKINKGHYQRDQNVLLSVKQNKIICIQAGIYIHTYVFFSPFHLSRPSPHICRPVSTIKYWVFSSHVSCQFISVHILPVVVDSSPSRPPPSSLPRYQHDHHFFHVQELCMFSQSMWQLVSLMWYAIIQNCIHLEITYVFDACKIEFIL